MQNAIEFRGVGGGVGFVHECFKEADLSDLESKLVEDLQAG